MENPSGHQNAVVAAFARRQVAEEAERKLACGGIFLSVHKAGPVMVLGRSAGETTCHG